MASTMVVTVDNNAPNPSTGNVSSTPFLYYAFLFSQQGADNPSVTVLGTNITTPVVWTRTGVGQYKAENAEFVVYRTVCKPFGASDNAVCIPVSFNTTGYIGVNAGAQDGIVTLGCFDNPTDFNGMEYSTVGGSFTLEICVYPEIVT